MNDEVAVPAELDPRTGNEIGSEALTARDRELERSRRADAARITALVQYMLHRGEDGRDCRPGESRSAPATRGGERWVARS